MNLKSWAIAGAVAVITIGGVAIGLEITRGSAKPARPEVSEITNRLHETWCRVQFDLTNISTSVSRKHKVDELMVGLSVPLTELRSDSWPPNVSQDAHRLAQAVGRYRSAVVRFDEDFVVGKSLDAVASATSALRSGVSEIRSDVGLPRYPGEQSWFFSCPELATGSAPSSVDTGFEHHAAC